MPADSVSTQTIRPHQCKADKKGTQAGAANLDRLAIHGELKRPQDAHTCAHTDYCATGPRDRWAPPALDPVGGPILAWRG